ncbi:hypothetical protein MRX96_005797 [Rhipicephalus microplus]
MALSKERERKQYLQVFLKQYTSEFPCIVESRKGKHFAFCAVCGSDISISHGGKTDVVAHVSSKKHVSHMQCKEKQQQLGQFFSKRNSDSDVIRAECLFTGFLQENNLPLTVSDPVGPLLRKMFPTSDVAKRYGCARTKTSAIVGEMANHTQERIEDGAKREATVNGVPNSGKKEFAPGREVWSRQYSQLGQRWLPGTVTTVEGKRLLTVNTPRGVQRRHVDQVRPRDSSTPVKKEPCETLMAMEQLPLSSSGIQSTSSEALQAGLSEPGEEASGGGIEPASPRSTAEPLPLRRSTRARKPPDRF